MYELPADVYDTLELSSLAYGGIGAGNNQVGGTPYCVYGHARFADGWMGDVEIALRCTGLTLFTNDNAVSDFNTRHGLDAMSRIGFADWCDELGVERSD